MLIRAVSFAVCLSVTEEIRKRRKGKREMVWVILNAFSCEDFLEICVLK